MHIRGVLMRNKTIGMLMRNKATYIHTYTHTYIHIYTHTHTHTHIHTYNHTHAHTHSYMAYRDIVGVAVLHTAGLSSSRNLYI